MVPDEVELSEEHEAHPMVHIAAQAIDVGVQRRQRCGWCGAVLIDVDVTTCAVAGLEVSVDGVEQKWDGPSTWPTGALVAHEDSMWWVVEHEDGAQLPANCCAQLPHEITGHAG